MKRAVTIVSYVYGLACIALILGLPRNKYEWMLDAAEPGSPVSFCGLPHDPDGPFRALIFAWLAVAPLVLAGLWGMFRSRSPNGILVVGMLLMAFAWVRLIALTPTC